MNKLSFDPFRHLQPWSCFSQQSCWLSLWKPIPRGCTGWLRWPGSLCRLHKVSCLIFNTYCCELNWDCFFWFWLYVTPGAADMGRAYLDMRRANWKNSDKYFHARGNYDAARRGPGGRWAAKVIRWVLGFLHPLRLPRHVVLLLMHVFSLQRWQGVGTAENRPRHSSWLCCRSDGEPLGSEWRQSQCFQTKGSSEKILVNLQMAKKATCGKTGWFQDNPKFTFLKSYHAFALFSSSHQLQWYRFCIVGSYNWSSLSVWVYVDFFTWNKHRLKDWRGIFYLYFS